MEGQFSKQVEAVFAKDGPLSKATENYVPRASQIEYACSVAEALETGESLVAEAGTGTGKTFAYLVPALLHSGRVLVSTAGKTLQDQLYFKDIPAILKALGMGARIALLKGRANYICKLRLEHACEENAAKSREEVVHLQKIQRFAQQSETGERGDIVDVPEDSGIWPEVTSTADNCLGNKCEHYEDCFVMKAREKVKEADILVINHHLFLSDIALKDNQITDFLPDFDLVVIDEAHQLLNICSDFFAEKLSLSEINSFLKDVLVAAGTLSGEIVVQWKELTKSVDQSMKDLLLTSTNILQDTDKPIAISKFSDARLLVEPMQRLLSSMADLSDALLQSKDASAEAESCYERSAKFVESLQYWTDVFSGKKTDSKVPIIHWFTLRKSTMNFNATPISFSEKLNSARDSQGKPWVLTSATLSMNGNFDHFVEEMGLEDAKTKHWDSPFDYKSQALLYIPDDIPQPGVQDFPDKVAAKIWPFIKENQGRAFVLCTTLRAMETIGKHLRYYAERDDLPLKILVQKEAPKQELLRQFKESGSAVLVGSMSFWEGVDIKGDVLSLVIIDKIPFPPPGDPVFDGKCDFVTAKGEDPFKKISIPQATMHLMQGAGRLIRDHKDLGMLMICDSRLTRRSYGKVIWQSLPDFARTTRMDVAFDFVKEMAAMRKEKS